MIPIQTRDVIKIK